MLKVSVEPLDPLAVGWKLYVDPTVTAVPGVPEIVVAAPLGGGDDPDEAAATVIANVGNETLALPSLTEMTMFAYEPTCALVGVPVRAPVDVLKVAHDGLFWIAKVSELPSGSRAVGVNE
jgi:hypothetical protein